MNDTTWFWQIVDAHGLAEFSSDETVALREILNRSHRFESEIEAISAAIGSTRFMDPPDGGDVSLAEQVKRMREALTTAESERDELLREKERLAKERDENRAHWLKAEAEAYELKYAAAGGEDAPGSAHTVTVADVDRWRRENSATIASQSERIAVLEAALRAYHAAYSDRRFAPEGSYEACDAAAQLEDAHDGARSALAPLGEE